MATNDYTAALRQGRRSYRAALTKGEYPYLPVLDEIMSYTEVAGMENIGIMDIPLSKIVGTKTVGRSNAFANNFMPLLPEESEFGMKWAAVYKHQIEDGISDPIVAYEFMNQFYVQEGNKRVSVMKYLQTYSIAASVTRLVPKKTDDKENRLYFEFLDFYEVSRSYDVCFTREGSYKKLLKLMGKKEDEVWSDDDRMNLHFACYNFERAFHKEHGENLDINVSDAFLIYVEIYGYDKVKSQSEGEILKALQKMWTEITLADQGSQVELVQNPEQVKAIDDLLNDDGHWGDRLAEDPGDPAYSYIYCQQETLKAGQKEEDRKYEELVRFTVSASEDVVTLVILEELPSLLHVDLGDFLTFTIDVPAETAEALRDPSRFLE